MFAHHQSKNGLSYDKHTTTGKHQRHRFQK